MHATLPRLAKPTLLILVLGLVALAFALPQGTMAQNGHLVWDPATRTHEWIHDEARMAAHGIANAAGGYAVLLTLASLALPYLKRPKLLRWHSRIGIAIMVLAAIHVAMYLWEGSFRGWLPGMLSFLAFGLHGATGAMKARLARGWGPARWRIVHRGSAWAALLFTLQHIVIASWHFGLARWFEEGRW